MGTRQAQIAIESVAKSYPSRRGPIHALSDISLAVEPREFVSLLGPSGCGKSTLLLIVAGLRPPSAGRVVIDGEVVRGPRTALGIAFQRPVLLDWRTVIDNVLVQIELRGLSRGPYRDAAERLLDQMGLREFAHRRPYELSGGMQQRVALCRALIHDPPLLLMDEPFSALDAFTRDQLCIDIQRLWMASSKTVLFVTHSIQEAVFLSDRVVVMTPRPGRVEEILDIDLPRPRRLATRESPDFLKYVSEVKDVFLRHGVLRDAE